MQGEFAEKPQNAILYIVGILVGLGLVMVYSSTAFRSLSFADSAYNLRRQAMWIGVAVVGMLFAMQTDYRKLLKFAPYLMALSIVLLILVLIPGIGYKVGGARRWFRLGPISFQPSEFAKFAAILFAAYYATTYRDRLRRFWKGFLPAALTIGLAAGLILMEPDLGSSVFLVTVSLTVLLVAGIKLWHLFPLIGLSAPGLVYLIMTRFPHVMRRLAAFFNPGADPLGQGHHVHQSLIALGSGGLFGAGLGQGRQKLAFLPAGPTDFIFAHIGEEIGFAGTCFVIVLFMALLLMGIRVAKRAPDLGGFLLAFGIIFAIILQAVINIAVVTGTVPPKGIPLPFISFGGSGLFFLMFSIGLLVNIARAREKELGRRRAKAAMATERGRSEE